LVGGRHAKPHLGQFSAIDELLTGRENLRLMADLGHLDRPRGKQVIDELLERLDLAEAADRRAQTYSGGMKRRLDLAMTLIGSPRLIFLDEPTAGLDPAAGASCGGSCASRSPTA
jgi:ABC-2 type transport system ATP-binding protein